jgi:hypothetical protein
MTRKSLTLLAAIMLTTLTGSLTAANPKLDARLKQLLKRFPQADTNKDGTLTVTEARAYASKMTGNGRKSSNVPREIIDSAVQAQGNSFDALKIAQAPKGPSLRHYSPVVITGADIRAIVGIEPGKLVAFGFDGKWRQIPVQVDQRDTRDYFNDIYNAWKNAGKGRACYKPRPGFRSLVYADPNTWTGPDSDPKIDDNDEIVFMYKDSGAKATGAPPSVIAGSGVQIELTDPLAEGAKAYVYLFESAGKLDPSAGKDYVSYKFKLKAGPYKENWIICGPQPASGYKNPEDSTISTKFYEHHFSAKNISDGLKIKVPYGTNIDILDMHKALFAPGVPARSVLTFNMGEGAFICNIDGPVRTIRSAVGTNSGPLTQFEWISYERRQDMRNFLRVHAIKGVVSFIDYSPQAAGMTYMNNNNPAGVTVDGKPDKVKPGPLAWELIFGKQGSLATIYHADGSVPVKVSSYYNDDAETTIRQVSGDKAAIGASGTWIVGGIASTDPGRGKAKTFKNTRTYFHGLDKPTPATAAKLLFEEAFPLKIKASKM